MANFLASIFGTELDKVNCSFYFVSSSHAKQKTADIQKRNDKEQNQKKKANTSPLENRRLPPRRPLLPQTRQALLLPNDPHAKPLPEPSLRSQEPHEPLAAAEPFRRILRRYMVRAMQVRRVGGASRLRQQQRPYVPSLIFLLSSPSIISPVPCSPFPVLPWMIRIHYLDYRPGGFTC